MNLRQLALKFWQVLNRRDFGRRRKRGQGRYARAYDVGLTQAEAEFMLDSLITTIIMVLREGEDIQLNRLGRFHTVHRPARQIRSNLDGSVHEIEEKFTVKFKPSQMLLDYINYERDIERELPPKWEDVMERNRLEGLELDRWLRGEIGHGELDRRIREIREKFNHPPDPERDDY